MTAPKLHKEVIKQKCGCTKTIHTPDQPLDAMLDTMSWIIEIHCKKHQKQIEDTQRAEEAKKINSMRNHAEPTNCYICGKHLCHMSYFDGEGTYLICDNCM